MPSLRQYCGRLVAKLGINLCCRSPGLRSDLQYLADSYVHFILRWTLWKIIWWWTNKPQSKRSFTQLKRLRKLIKAIEENREILIHLKLERKETTHLSQIKTGSKEVDPQTATEKAKTPTAPKNTPLWADSVFGIDVSVRELHVNHQEIIPSFARLPDIVEEVYSAIGGDDKDLNKRMTKSMLMYYTTAIFWARLLDIKAKRGNANLTFEEIEFCKAMAIQDYNIPQPLYLFSKGIGEVKDATGKTVRLKDHILPRVIQRGLGGYHSAAITAETHNLYEEIPSLGICGDIPMAETADAAHPM